MKGYNFYKFLLLPIIFASMNVSAQNLSTEVVVDRTVETSLPEAQPLKNIFPAMLIPPTPDLNLKQADYSLWADFAPLSQTGVAPDYTGIAAPDRRRGYVWLGYFPTYNLGLAAGYRFVDKANTQAGASLNFDGYSYTNRHPSESVSDNAFKINAFARHRLKNGLQLGGLLSYGFDAVKNPNDVYDKQSINNFYMLLSAERVTKGVSYNANVDFRYFGLGKALSAAQGSCSESIFRAYGGLLFPVGDALKVGADIEGDILGSSDRMALGKLTPKILITTGSVDLDLGLQFDLGLSVPGNRFHVAPKVSGVWHLMSLASIYGTFKGGTQLLSMYNLYCYSPFAAKTHVAIPSYSPIDATVGVRLGAFGGFKFDIFAGYGRVNNTLMPMAGRNLEYSTLTFTPADISGWRFGLAVAYSHSNVFDASARLNFGPEGLTSDEGQYFDRAKYSFEVKGEYCPIKNWTFNLKYELRGGRRVGSAVYAGTDIDMDRLSFLGLGATWNVRENLGVFLRLDNILNNHPELLPGLTYQGFHGLLGVDLRF